MNSSVDLCKVPAAPPPEGYSSNFDNPTSMAPALIGVISVTTLWAITFTSARLWVNFQKLGWADWFNLIALLHSIAILGIEGTQVTVARHIWDVPACFFDKSYAQGIFIPAILLQTGAFFAKASIFLLYLQLFTVKKSMRFAIYSGLTFSFFLYGVGVAVATYYETPRNGENWTDILDGRTLIPLPWWQAQSALSVALDIYIFILPLPVISRLKMPVRRRIQLVVIFSLALGGIGSSIASLVERIEIAHAYDQTWISAILSLCSAVELNVAIIVGSAPAFAGFARSHVLELPVVRFLLSSISLTSKGKSYDSEAPLENLEGMHGNHAAERNHRYYELSDVGMYKRESNTA
ncbi:hypothetical protein GQX73_g7452 [Xylaria multiplex]|uniref:Rhodopsin domain-containing protein n=1 Tax=Xylaria multiplex TaxID=323545 RepID=A0A7C8MQZ4_9PEZI|nr:hypothetical protein GQX73_g7452 [Xylaria multiplex]